LSKQYAEARKNIATKPSRLTTVKRKSYGVLAQQDQSVTDVWGADNEEFVHKLERFPTASDRGGQGEFQCLTEELAI
jgi:hypothetical protein